MTVLILFFRYQQFVTNKMPNSPHWDFSNPLEIILKSSLWGLCAMNEENTFLIFTEGEDIIPFSFFQQMLIECLPVVRLWRYKLSP